MTTIKELEKLPYIDITIRLYETSLPYEDKNGTKKYFATLRYQDCGSDVTNIDGTELGKVTGAMGGILFIKVGDREFCLPPDDIWYNVVDKIGFVIPEVSPEILNKNNDIDNKELNNITNESENELEKLFDEDESDEDEEEVEEMSMPYKYSGEIYPPDWNLEPTGYTGGNLEDIPEPHYWYWPDAKKKRKVDIRITRYYGFGKHYYVSIREEDNYIWNAVDNDDWPPVGWIKLWSRDKETGKGLTDWDLNIDEFYKIEDDDEESFKFHYNSYFEAKTICDKIIAKYFPKETHEIIWDGNIDELYEQHFYKEGD